MDAPLDGIRCWSKGASILVMGVMGSIAPFSSIELFAMHYGIAVSKKCIFRWNFNSNFNNNNNKLSTKYSKIDQKYS